MYLVVYEVIGLFVFCCKSKKKSIINNCIKEKKVNMK